VYRFGDCLIGVRSSSMSLDEVLRAALAQRVVPDLVAPHANYSIRIEHPESRAVGDPVHVLYSSGCLVARSRNPFEVLAALIRELAVNELRGDERAMVGCAVLQRRDGHALLLSAVARRQAVQQTRRLHSAGLSVVHTPAVILDPRTLEAVVPSPPFAVNDEALQRVDGGDRSQLEAAMSEQRHPIAAWVFMSLPGRLEPARKAMALTKAASALRNEPNPRASTIRTLADVLRHTDVLAAGDLTSLDLIPLLAKTEMR